MRRLHTLLDVTCVLLGLAGGAAMTSRAEGPAEADSGVQMRGGGARIAQGVFGGVVLPADHAEGARVLAAVRGARDVLPPSLRVPVVVQLEPLALTFAPSLGPVHAYGSARVIAVEPGARSDRSIWVHELVHLAAAGARPSALAGARLMTAVDEGVADFTAAVFGASPVVGSVAAGESRDLREPPLVGDSEWAYLALPRAPFDAHRLGWSLAGSLYREEAPGHAELAIDVVQALSSRAPFRADGTPEAVLAEWIARCPARSRPALAHAVRQWIPPELFPPEGSS